jgi:hypothetical protein
MPEYDGDEVRSWAELADEFALQSDRSQHDSSAVPIPVHEGQIDQFQLGRADAFGTAAKRVRFLIPRLGDPHGPPLAGQVIQGDVVDRCPLGTLLRATQAAVVAIRTVNGWSVSGLSSSQARSIMKINSWRVVEVPESPLTT